MARVLIKPYVSPNCVLLALDWPDGGSREDFLGFAIRRTPGFRNQPQSWLPNRLGFDGPAPQGQDLPSHENPIQKFLWWDARVDDADRGRQFTYEAMPVVGARNNLQRLEESAAQAVIALPKLVEGRIGTCFNRAVTSSQAFSRKFGGELEGERLEKALAWLANGLEQVIPGFLAGSERLEAVIYHLTDGHWVIPALEAFPGSVSLVFNQTRKDDSNREAVERLRGDRKKFSPRTRASIMHNKFIVRLRRGRPAAVLMGSANFTTAGLTTQANLIHSFDSPALARLYLDRKKLLEEDPTLAETAQQAGWSAPVQVDEAQVRVFFSPERQGQRKSIDAVVKAVRQATSSVLFCLFMPTDAQLRRAIFEAGDRGLMMFGLVNKISERPPQGESENAGAEAQVEIFHRSRRDRDVFAHNMYAGAGRPGGFWWETAELPGPRSQWPVYIHHKFVVIDAETDHPIIYTGSANMSKNSLYRNDENLLEIKGSTRLAAIYHTEFLRLYEHYRARAVWNRCMEGKVETLKLREDSQWARKYYQEGTPEYKARVGMVGGAPRARAARAGRSF